jgi:uncharacterized protein YbdZ (MbtH family)
MANGKYIRTAAHQANINAALRKEVIYELPHGIKVVGEYCKKRYVMCYIEAHHLFPNSKVSAIGRQTVQRSRVMMTALLGRTLDRNEHVHHGPLGRQDDSYENISLLPVADHNRHHKLGWKHSLATRDQIAESLLTAYKEGRHALPTELTFAGRHHTLEAREAIAASRRGKICINNGERQIMHPAEVAIPLGWVHGMLPKVMHIKRVAP